MKVNNWLSININEDNVGFCKVYNIEFRSFSSIWNVKFERIYNINNVSLLLGIEWVFSRLF